MWTTVYSKPGGSQLLTGMSVLEETGAHHVALCMHGGSAVVLRWAAPGIGAHEPAALGRVEWHLGGDDRCVFSRRQLFYVPCC